MNHAGKRVSWMALVIAGIAACSSSSSSSGSSSTDAGSGGQDCYQPQVDTITSSTGKTLRTFTPPCDPGANAFVFSISGEANAIVGYAYPPYDLTTATYMVDGWSWKIDAYIVVIDHITLWTNPNESSSDQSQHGPAVAQLDGPFVVDLHKGGPLDGKGGAGQQALAIGKLLNQNLSGNAAFEPTATYGFGFSTVQATYDAINVNLTSEEQADFDYMVENGASVYYRGTASWNGTQSGGQMGFGICSKDPATDYADMAETCAVATASGDAGTGGGGDGGAGTCPMLYDFSKLPQT